MKYDSILWNPQIKTPENEYLKKHNYLFDKDEFLSDKLKKYNINTAQRDLQEDISPYHGFLAKARTVLTNNITVYKLTDDLIKAIKKTTIDELKSNQTLGLRNFLILESHDPKLNLFGDINSIVCYYHQLADEGKEFYKSNYLFNILFHVHSKDDQNWYKTAIEINDDAREAKARFLYTGANLFIIEHPSEFLWSLGKTDYERNTLMDVGFCEKCKSHNKCKTPLYPFAQNIYNFCYEGLLDNIFSFILTFNYMLEADNSPIYDKKKIEHTSHAITKKGKIIEKKQDWIIKYLYLDETKMEYEKQSGGGTELDKENLTLKETNVKEHWRYQACGPGFSERRLTRIKSHPSKKWVREGDTKIITGIKKP